MQGPANLPPSNQPVNTLLSQVKSAKNLVVKNLSEVAKEHLMPIMQDINEIASKIFAKAKEVATPIRVKLSDHKATRNDELITIDEENVNLLKSGGTAFTAHKGVPLELFKENLVGENQYKIPKPSAEKSDKGKAPEKAPEALKSAKPTTDQDVENEAVAAEKAAKAAQPNRSVTDKVGNKANLSETIGKDQQRVDAVLPEFLMDVGAIGTGKPDPTLKQEVVKKLMGKREPLSDVEFKRFNLNNPTEVLKMNVNELQECKISQRGGFFGDKPTVEGHMQWDVNFADKRLFFSTKQMLGAQDEMQQMRFPALATVKQANLKHFNQADYKEGEDPAKLGQYEAAIVKGVTDYGTIDSRGIYGEAFAFDTQLVNGKPEIRGRQAAEILPKVTPQEPRVRNVLAIASTNNKYAQVGSPTSLEDIKENFLTAFNGFTAAKKESRFSRFKMPN